jgi:hypothetical protein
VNDDLERLCNEAVAVSLEVYARFKEVAESFEIFTRCEAVAFSFEVLDGNVTEKGLND